MVQLSFMQKPGISTLHSRPLWEESRWSPWRTWGPCTTACKSCRVLRLASTKKRLPLGHPDRHDALGHHAWVLAHYLCSLLTHNHLAGHFGKHLRGASLGRMAWGKKTRALLMLLLLASVLCDKIGVLLLLFAHLEENYENK